MENDATYDLSDACVHSAAQWSSRSVELKQTQLSLALISAAGIGLRSLRVLANVWRAELWRPNEIRAQSRAITEAAVGDFLEMCENITRKNRNRFSSQYLYIVLRWHFVGLVSRHQRLWSNSPTTTRTRKSADLSQVVIKNPSKEFLNPDTTYSTNIGRRQTDAGCHMTSLVEVINMEDWDRETARYWSVITETTAKCAQKYQQTPVCHQLIVVSVSVLYQTTLKELFCNHRSHFSGKANHCEGYSLTSVEFFLLAFISMVCT